MTIGSIEDVTHNGIVIPLALACLVAAGGCTRGAAAAPASAKDAREPASVAIEYEVARKGDDNAVLLRGRTSIDARHEAGVEHHARDREDLRFAARERNDGSFDVEMRYRESTPDGTDIRWEPVLRVARGTTASADVAGNGWARTVSVKVE
jgi:hypothetical protein